MPAVGIRATSSVTAAVSVGTELWVIWGDIAVAQLEQTRSARQRLATKLDAGEEVDSNEELHAAMLTIVAAATSIDGFATVVKSEGVIAQVSGHAPPRAVFIWETLRAGFDVGSRTNEWPGALKDLFVLRSDQTAGGLLHPRTVFGAPASHPLLPSVSPARALYTLESAEKAVALMREIYRTCRADAVRPGNEALKTRIEGLAGVQARVS
jgi:hypothetical protein